MKQFWARPKISKLFKKRVDNLLFPTYDEMWNLVNTMLILMPLKKVIEAFPHITKNMEYVDDTLTQFLTKELEHVV